MYRLYASITPFLRKGLRHPWILVSVAIIEQSPLDSEGQLYLWFLCLETNWLKCGLSSGLSDKESVVLRAVGKLAYWLTFQGVAWASVSGRMRVIGLGFQCRVEVRMGCCLYKVMNLRKEWDGMSQPVCGDCRSQTAGYQPEPESSAGRPPPTIACRGHLMLS